MKESGNATSREEAQKKIRQILTKYNLITIAAQEALIRHEATTTKDHLKPNKCNHFLGYFNGEEVHETDEDGSITISDQLRWKGILDTDSRRKALEEPGGAEGRFSYCPHCGTKLDWEEIVNRISQETIEEKGPMTPLHPMHGKSILSHLVMSRHPGDTNNHDWDDGWSTSDQPCPTCKNVRMWQTGWYDDSRENGGACIGTRLECGNCGHTERH